MFLPRGVLSGNVFDSCIIELTRVDSEDEYSESTLASAGYVEEKYFFSFLPYVGDSSSQIVFFSQSKTNMFVHGLGESLGRCQKCLCLCIRL